MQSGLFIKNRTERLIRSFRALGLRKQVVNEFSRQYVFNIMLRDNVI